MTIRAVLCEDDHWCWMRPLSWGAPAWEIPVGLFSLRERVESRDGFDGGVMLTRPQLGPLAKQDHWQDGWAHCSAGDLWLTSRLGAHAEVLAGLLNEAEAGGEFAWLVGDGLVAASLGAEASDRMHTAWERWAAAAPAPSATALREPFTPRAVLDGWHEAAKKGEAVLLTPAEPPASPPSLMALWEAWQSLPYLVLDAIWNVVAATEIALAADVLNCVGRSGSLRPYGLVAEGGDPVWKGDDAWTALAAQEAAARWPGVHVLGDPGRVVTGAGVTVEPGVVLDVRSGPIALGRMTRVQSGCRLEGPLALGPGCLVKAGARIYGGTSLGVGCRVAGEIGETVGMHYLNKQHDGFIGHAVLGSWLNLGALTTCSDLKNNYGSVRVDLGWGPVDTGERFVGLMAADHVKTAIGTLLNTGTCVGFAANLFGAGMPPKSVPGFAWGWDGAAYEVEKAVRTAEIVMARRGCRMTEDHRKLFQALA